MKTLNRCWICRSAWCRSNRFDPKPCCSCFGWPRNLKAIQGDYVTTAPLTGKILINAFYEPSTRTRLSFDSAWHRLGGSSINITDRATTGIAKGESLEDVAHMFNNYGDCVVLRDSDPGAVYAMTSTLRIPIINAGNGIDEHPTQAMADLFTIFKWRPKLAES